MALELQVQSTDGESRRGTLSFIRADGTVCEVQTPTFMPCGTYGSVKGLSPSVLDGCGVQVLLGNTFHLMLRPGMDIIEAHGGEIQVNSTQGEGTLFQIYLPMDVE